MTLTADSPSGARIKLWVENDLHERVYYKEFSLKGGRRTRIVDLSDSCGAPGFYHVTAVSAGEGYTGVSRWMAVSPERVTCPAGKPEGFDDYWREARRELDSVGPDYRLRRCDSLSAVGYRDVYIAEMRSVGGLVIRGYYLAPRGGGRHHAVLRLPYYGEHFNRLEPYLKDRAGADRAELLLCVRGHGLSRDVFNPGFGMPGVWGYHLYDMHRLAYRAIYMDCLRGLEFLSSRGEVDSQRIGVMGGSQGGGLALATAALAADKVAACAFFDPFPCDVAHQTRIRTVWLSELRGYLNHYGASCSLAEALRLQSLLDVAWLAPRIVCPSLLALSLADDDCPPHGSFTAYNRIMGPKEYTVFPLDGHSESHYDYMLGWLDRRLRPGAVGKPVR